MKMKEWRGTDVSQTFKQAIIKLREESKNKVSKEKSQSELRRQAWKILYRWQGLHLTGNVEGIQVAESKKGVKNA